MKKARSLAAVVLAVIAPGCVRENRVAAAPAAPTVWERQVQNARDAGDGDYLLRRLRDRAAAAPESVPARMELALAYRDRGYPDIALEICRLAVGRFPESPDAQLGLAKALRDSGQRDEAIHALSAFLASHPQKSPDYFAWLGILHDEVGHWTEGEPAHRKALELAPGADYLHNNLGYNLMMQAKDGEAAAEFRTALRLNPASQMARNNLGLALAHQNAGEQAIANWQSAADQATAHNNLAVVWIEKGNYAEARKELAVALRYNKAHSAALRNLELVSRLDGMAVILDAQSQATWRARWKAGFWRLFVGPLDDSRAGAGNTASAPITGGEQ